jgi:hypothetical protein
MAETPEQAQAPEPPLMPEGKVEEPLPLPPNPPGMNDPTVPPAPTTEDPLLKKWYDLGEEARESIIAPGTMEERSKFVYDAVMAVVTDATFNDVTQVNVWYGLGVTLSGFMGQAGVPVETVATQVRDATLAVTNPPVEVNP